MCDHNPAKSAHQTVQQRDNYKKKKKRKLYHAISRIMSNFMIWLLLILTLALHEQKDYPDSNLLDRIAQNKNEILGPCHPTKFFFCIGQMTWILNWSTFTENSLLLIFCLVSLVTNYNFTLASIKYDFPYPPKLWVK